MPCIPRAFCSVCAALICLDCCPNHTAAHHPGTNAVLVEVLIKLSFLFLVPCTILIGLTFLSFLLSLLACSQVVMVEGFPALTHRDVRTNGLGYDWNHIQRVKHDGNTWVMLRSDRPKRAHSELHKRCRCRCPIAPKNTFCSPSCKVSGLQFLNLGLLGWN